MAHVIDALFVELGIDTTQFTRGQRQALASFRRTQQEAHKQALAIQKSGDVAADFYKKLRNGVLTFFAVLTAGRGIRDFIRDLSQGDAQMGQLAASLGMSTQELAQWAKAVELAGGNANAAVSTVAALSSKLQAFRFGQGDTGFLNLLGQRNVSAQNADGSLKTTLQLLNDIADAAERMPAAEGTTWMSMLGIDPETQKLMRRPRAERQRMLGQAGALGLPDDADSKRMQQFNQDLLKLQTQILDLARKLFNDLEPSIHEFLTTLSDWLQQNRPLLEGEMAQKLRELGEWFKGIDWRDIGERADHVLSVIKSIVDAMGGWQVATEALIGVWLGAKAIKMMSMLALVFGGPARLAGLGALLGAAAATNVVTQGGDAFSEGQHGGEYTPLQYGAFLTQSMRGEPLTGDTQQRTKEAMAFFMDKGWSREDAAAIVGNLLAENSTLDPNKWEDGGGGGYGIAQWTPEDRKRSAGAVIGRETIVGTTFREQLEAVHGELTRGTHKRVGDALRAETNFLGKSAIVTRDYESPRDAESQIARRGALGVRAMKTVADPKAPGGGVAPTRSLSGPDAGWWNEQMRRTVPASPGGQTVSMNIGDVHVHTSATDGRGIARDIKGALASEFRRDPSRMATRANTGLA